MFCFIHVFPVKTLYISPEWEKNGVPDLFFECVTSILKCDEVCANHIIIMMLEIMHPCFDVGTYGSNRRSPLGHLSRVVAVPEARWLMPEWWCLATHSAKFSLKYLLKLNEDSRLLCAARIVSLDLSTTIPAADGMSPLNSRSWHLCCSDGQYYGWNWYTIESRSERPLDLQTAKFYYMT